MRRRYSVTLVMGLLVVLALAVSPAPVLAATYDITVDGSIDTPDRTVTFDGSSYDVSAVKQADPGDSVTVNVKAPSDELVEVTVYNSERQIVESKEIVVSESRTYESLTYDLSGYSAGSYMFTVQYDGETKVVHPLVVRAYDVSITAPSDATTAERIDLSATITELRSASMSGVEFVIVNEEDSLRVDAAETADGSYEATADMSSLSPGEYSVYATVRGTEEVDGNKVRLGLSQPETLSVSSPSTESSSEGGNSGDSSGGGGVADSVTETVASQETATPIQINSTTTQPPTTPETTDATGTASDGESPTTTTESSTSQGESVTTTQSTTTESGAITPRSPTETQDTTTSTTGPGFGAVLSVLALGTLVAVSVLRRRRDA